jgi:hypothetical protein
MPSVWYFDEYKLARISHVHREKRGRGCQLPVARYRLALGAGKWPVVEPHTCRLVVFRVLELIFAQLVTGNW